MDNVEKFVLLYKILVPLVSIFASLIFNMLTELCEHSIRGKKERIRIDVGHVFITWAIISGALYIPMGIIFR